MNIMVKDTRFIDVTLTKEQLLEIVTSELKNMIGVEGYRETVYYLNKNNEIIESETRYTSHSYEVEKKVRDATPVDLAVFTILDAYTKFNKEIK